MMGAAITHKGKQFSESPPLSNNQTDDKAYQSRLQSIISEAEDYGDFQQEIQQLLAHLSEVHFQDDSEQLVSAAIDIKTLWKLSQHTMLGSMRTTLANLISKPSNVSAFKNLLEYIKESGDCFIACRNELWRCMKLMLCVLWNCTDISQPLCQEVVESKILTSCIQLLTKYSQCQDFESDEKKLFMVKAFLGILHNVVRNYPDCREEVLSDGCMLTLPKLLKATNPLVKAKSLMVASYLVTEEQNELIQSSNDTIIFLLNVLTDSLKSHSHMSTKYGMSCLETLKGLNNISMNDVNKVKVVSNGGLKLYAELVTSGNEEEKESAALGVWTLAFAADNRHSIIQEPGLVDGLRTLIKEKNTSGAHSARGALWEVFHGHEKVTSGIDSNIPHIMISYQWDAQKIMIKVKDALWNAGYKVWMDVEHMTGSTLEAMALAVEQASVVLICMSEKYKLSPSCRTESEYIFRLRKVIIPLRVQHGYRPDGWLGMLVGSNLYFDFSSEQKAESNIPKLMKELGDRGKISLLASLSTSKDEVDSAPIKQEKQPTPTSMPVGTRDITAEHWSPEDVANWLTSIQLKQIIDRLVLFDGSMLLELKQIKNTAPEFFFRTLQQELSMDLPTVLMFSKHLGKLV